MSATRHAYVRILMSAVHKWLWMVMVDMADSGYFVLASHDGDQ